MKNKIICLLLLVFSISFFSAARIVKGKCSTTCTKSTKAKSEIKSTKETEKKRDAGVAALNNFFLNS